MRKNIFLQGSQPLTLAYGRESKTKRVWESLEWEKGNNSGMLWLDLNLCEVGGKLTRSKCLMWFVCTIYLVFLQSWVGYGRKVYKPAIVDQVLTVLDKLLQTLWFGFLEWLLQIL